MTDELTDANSERAVGRLIGAAGRGPKASDEARRRIYDAVRAEWLNATAVPPHAQPSRSRRPFASLPGWALPSVAAVAAVLIGVGLTYLSPRPEVPRAEQAAEIVKVIGEYEIRPPRADGERTRDDRSVRVGDHLATGASSALALQLVNGVELRLGAGSAVAFSAADVVEIQSGRVYLDTGAPSGNATRMLDVLTPYGIVRHVGTQYSVSLEGASLRIRVREGAVSFSDGRDQYVGERGEELIVSDDSRPERVEIPVTGQEWQWAESLATSPIADEQRLIDLLRWVSRETGRELQFASPAVERAAESTLLRGAGGLAPAELLLAIDGTTSQVRVNVSATRLLVYQ